MADEEKVLLRLEIEGTTEELQSIEAIRAEMLKAQNVLRDMKRDSRKGVFVDQQALVKEEKNLKILSNEYRQLQRQQVAATEAANTNQKEGVKTISTMRAQLTRLKKDWADIEYGSESWKEHTKQIRILNDEIALAEQRTGNFTRNVGNYAGDINRSFAAMGVSTGRFGQALMAVGSAQSVAAKGTITWIRSLGGLQKALLATGVGAFVVVLGLILANMDKLTEMFKDAAGRAKDLADQQERLLEQSKQKQLLYSEEERRLRLLGESEINLMAIRLERQRQELQLLERALEVQRQLEDELWLKARRRERKKDQEEYEQSYKRRLELEYELVVSQNNLLETEVAIRELRKLSRKEASESWNEQQSNIERELELSERLRKAILDRAEARTKEKAAEFQIPGLEPEAAVTEGSAFPALDAELAAIRAMNQQAIFSYQERFDALKILEQQGGDIAEQAAQRRIELTREVSEITLAEMGYMFSGLRAALGEQTQAGKTAGIAEAIINTIRAGMQVYADPSLPLFAKIAAMVGVLAQGYAQVNKIRQVKTNFASGVIGVDGPGTGTSDSIDARISRGESVITAKATSKFAPQLAAMEAAVGNTPNYQLGRKRYASGIIAAGMGATDTMKAQQRMMRELMRNVTQIPVVVSERDITGTQAKVRKVKVSGNI
jgi:hypothetical protein